MCVAVAAVMVLAGGCAAAANALPRPATLAVSSPTLTVSPSTGLVAGQQVQVSVAGFAQHVTLSLSECAAPPAPASGAGCGASGAFALYTANSGSAQTSFTVRPSATSGRNGPQQVCHQQCVLVAVVIKYRTGVPRGPAPMALAPLSFSAAAQPTLADTSLQDLSWTSPTESWALAAQPCTTGTCARLAHTSDGGMSWQQLPDPPAVFQDGSADCSTRACVSNVRFASTTIGYLYGPALLMTTDGGRSWQVQS
ncbi:MAG: neocarzinostatin apoprotein domain-containing protein, partial [Sciscionella sp.]